MTIKMDRSVKEVTKRLKAVAPKLQKRAVSSALRAGARVVVKQAKANAPVDTGALKRNIIAKAGSKKYTKAGQVRVIIGVRHGRAGKNKKSAYARRGEDPFYFRFQELGYLATGRKKARKQSNARRVPGKRFLSRALEQQSGPALREITQRLAREVARLERRN